MTTLFKYLWYQLTFKLLGCSKVQFHSMLTPKHGPPGWFLEEKVSIMEAILRGEFKPAAKCNDSRKK